MVNLKIKPIVLCILDGWGYREETKDNAIYLAKTPFYDKLIKESPHSLLKTSGLAVGLPEGQMGNSEVGHMNIGSGRVVMQELPRINEAIKNKSLAKNKLIKEQINTLIQNGGTCHIMGLVSDGGVHSHQEHIEELVKIIASHGVKVKIHAFLDGRDTAPKSAIGYIEKLEKVISQFDNVEIATIAGRFYAMDRDNRWERVESEYNAIVTAKGEYCDHAVKAIENSYALGKTDEFVVPTIIGNYEGMLDNDAIIMANFRADRAREILQALLDKSFKGFSRKKIIKFSSKLGMVEYSSAHNKWMKTLFPAHELSDIFGEVIAKNNLKQLRIAETEKYAHVTFFFNGGREEQFKGEERIMVPSPKVTTYDMQPEMSAPVVTDHVIEAIEKDKFDIVIINYANTDMVGHTGDEKAAIKAVETIDKSLSRIVPAVEKEGGIIAISADHGNAEMMKDKETGQVHTAHTTGPVPFILAGNINKKIKLKDGSLCDIAPTLLELMNIAKPKKMTGETLIIK